MEKSIFKLVAAVTLSLLSLSAMAQVSNALAEKLIRKSGLWEQVAATPDHIQATIQQLSGPAGIPEAELNRIMKIARQSFATARIRKALLASVTNQMQVVHAQRAITWYESPTGQLITGLEEASSAVSSDINAALNEGNQVLESSTPKRQALITAILKASRSVHASVDIGIHTSVAVFRGMASSQTRNVEEATKAFRDAMQKQRPQMIASTMGQAMALSAVTYATVSDGELDAYVQFLSSDAASRMMDAMYQGMDKAYTQAAQDFGKQFLAKAKQAPL